jgi:hypothetical protein
MQYFSPQVTRNCEQKSGLPNTANVAGYAPLGSDTELAEQVRAVGGALEPFAVRYAVRKEAEYLSRMGWPSTLRLLHQRNKVYLLTTAVVRVVDGVVE